MTTQQEQQLFSTLRSLKKEVVELKEMIKPLAPKNDEFLTLAQATKHLELSERKVRYMLANGELPFATKVGRNWRFSKNGIINYLSRTR